MLKCGGSGIKARAGNKENNLASAPFFQRYKPTNNLSPMRSFLFLFCSLCLHLMLLAQPKNLVVNPSFEIPSDTIHALNPENDVQKAYGWDNPNNNKARLFTTVQRGTAEIIFDPYGSEWNFKARTGRNVAGIDVRGPLDEDKGVRGYLQGTLREPLTVGKKYIFGFWVHYHCEGANNIGIAFLPEKMKLAGKGIIPLQPVSYQAKVTPYNTKSTWTLVRDSFIAYKPYRNFIIGNFFPDSLTYVQSSRYNHYFAFIDDIFVVESNTQPATGYEPSLKEKEKWMHNDILAGQKNTAILLENIFFEYDSDRLLPESTPTLEQLRRQLMAFPAIKIRINGHTSTEGTTEHNQHLSDIRAQAIKAYLVHHGIAAKRIETIGFGETRPIVPDDSEEMRKKNRRVEFEILE
jgi:outer membrane protein OmpA-like peptidoglycan-associated protein